jgi:small neutral amino acid transporter SnatA (MarC family)
VSPHGVATLIILASLMPDELLQILGLLLVIMVLDFAAMLSARPLLARLGTALWIAEMILGVLQLALSVQAIVYGVRLLAVQLFGVHRAG